MRIVAQKQNEKPLKKKVFFSTLHIYFLFLQPNRELTDKMANWGYNAQLGISNWRFGIKDSRLGIGI